MQFPADLITFTEEILNGKFHFLCSGSFSAHLFALSPNMVWLLRAKTNLHQLTLKQCYEGFKEALITFDIREALKVTLERCIQNLTSKMEVFADIVNGWKRFIEKRQKREKENLWVYGEKYLKYSVFYKNRKIPKNLWTFW